MMLWSAVVVITVMVMMMRVVMAARMLMQVELRLLRIHLQLVGEQRQSCDQRVSRSLSGSAWLRLETFDEPRLCVVDNPILRFFFDANNVDSA